jgi:hypothetical protein
LKTLSVQQPYATLICLGLKKIEERTWGIKPQKILIHSTGGKNYGPNCTPDLRQFYEEIDDKDFCDLWEDNLIAEKVGESKYIYTDPDGFLSLRPECLHLKNQWEILSLIIDRCIGSQNGGLFPVSSIVGFVDVLKIKDYNGKKDWMLDNANLFIDPVLRVAGKLGLWEYKDITNKEVYHDYNSL